MGALIALYRLWLAVVSGYLIGGVLMADIVTRIANRGRADKVDLRKVGSGNPGSANALANLGTRWGVVVLLGDIGKGGAGAFAGRLIAGDVGAYTAAVASVAGHCFPATAGFKGGKGVATSAGTTLVCFPAYIPIDIGLVAGSYLWSRHAGKATAMASSVFVLAALLWKVRGWGNAWGTRVTWGLPLYALGTSAIIAYKFLTAPAHMGDRKDRPAATAEPAS
jgi:glycerol-3-phosphate acyltransferase PlsY